MENSTTTPADRNSEDWWKERVAASDVRIAKGDVGLIFIGDSITHGWEDEGAEIWAKYYKPRKAINLGFSGDRTQHVLWRLEQHPIKSLATKIDGKATPKLAVLMIGTNNSNRDDNTAAEIGAGIAAIVEQLEVQLPEAKVLILGIFPRGKKPDAQRKKNEDANAIAAKLADGQRVHFLDIGSKFLTADGTLTPEIMPDALHPNSKGYQIWADAMEPKLAELLGEKR
jgi:beta-glucosidase